MPNGNDNLIRSDLADELRLEGIKYKGYGIIPKFVMLDQSLSAEAKGIYAYFCSYAGSGNTLFPGRDKILSDLHMSKDAYYKHYNMLLNEGYIKAVQTSEGGIGQGFKKNIYTLVNKPKKYLKEKESPKPYAVLALPGIEAEGFGFIPKAIMTDNSVSVKAKALYAYYCSFSGSEGKACPKKETVLFHLQFSHNSYNKYQKELTEKNYIKIIQRQVEGRLCVSDIYIVDNPDKNKAQKGRQIEIVCPEKQCTKIKDTQKIKQQPKLQDTQIQDTQKQDPQIQDTNNNNIKINKNKNNSPNQQTAPQEGGWTDAKIFDEILKEGTLPESYLGNPEKLEDAVKLLANYKEYSQKESFDMFNDSDFRYSAYMLFVDALISLLEDSKGRQIDGRKVTNKTIMEKLTRYIKRDLDGRFSILQLASAAIELYKDAAKVTEPKAPIRFMQRMIWNAMVNGTIITDAALIHDFDEVTGESF